MYIHPEVAPSALLLMGITDPAPGSVWNTMPPHVHERRMEAYLYFDLAPETTASFHFMGRPDATRHLVVGNERGGDLARLVDPHGRRHRAYAFVWGMTGENQDYNDVNAARHLAELR